VMTHCDSNDYDDKTKYKGSLVVVTIMQVKDNDDNKNGGRNRC